MNENQENNLNGANTEMPNTNPVEQPQVITPEPVDTVSQSASAESVTPVETQPVTPVGTQPATPVEPVQPVTPVEPVQPVQPVVNPAPVSEPTPGKKKSNPIIVILLVIVLLGVCGYGLYTYTDIFKPKDKGDNTTTVAPETTTVVAGKEKTLSITDDIGSYYVSTLVLKNNKLYGVFLDDSNANNKEDSIDVSGKKAYVIQNDVKDAFLVEYGQSGNQTCIFVDSNGQAFAINVLTDGPLAAKKIDGATDVKDAYSLSTNGAVEYVLVDKNNNLISDGKYVYIDNDNNINSTKIKDGSIVNIKLKEKGIPDADGNVVDTYTVTIGGKTQELEAEYTYNSNVSSYISIELFEFDLCTNSNGEYVVGHNNCFVD